jgi:cytochrome c biogenesis protein CcmG, thiol:disulfide interchange protein DsbE
MRRRLVPVVAALVGAALVGMLVYGLTAQGSSRALDQAVAAGRWPDAPDASRALPVLDLARGDGATLSSWRGKVVVVNFWASWCDTCEAEARQIEQAQRTLAASGAGTVVGIDYKDTPGYARRYIARYGLTYPNLRDIDGSFADAYGTIALPETFVLDRRLRVVAIEREAITSESWLIRAIAKAERE